MPSKAPSCSADSAAPLEETLTPAETAKALKVSESWLANARVARPFSECSTSFPRTSAEHSTKSRARALVGTDGNGRSKPRNGPPPLGRGESRTLATTWRARPCCPLGRMVTVSGLASASTAASAIVCPQGG
jgi:hypothetical protein